MARKLAMVTSLLSLVLAGTAQAETFCVAAPGCVGTSAPSLQAAFDAADGAVGPDRIEVGPGEYAGPFLADEDNAVEVVGAGRDATRITLAADAVGSIALELRAAGSLVRGLGIRLDGGAGRTGLAAERAEEVAVQGTAAPATGFSGAEFQAGAVDLGAATGTIGIALEPVLGAFVEDAVVRAEVGIAGGPTAAQVAYSIARTRIDAARTGISLLGNAGIHDVAIALAGDPLATGIQIGPTLGAAALATVQYVTIAGEGSGIGVGVAALAMPPTGGGGATANVGNSVITGVADGIVTSGSDCPAPCAPAPAAATTSYTSYGTSRSTGPGGVTDANRVAGDPGLRADLRPRYDSPLVDAADPAALPSPQDAAGQPRSVDGNGDGTARSDIGALEYQRRAPQVDLLTAIPDAAQTGAPVAFSVDATDPEGEALSAAWAFSDGATATGFDVTRSFTTPGTVTATVTVTDAAGAATAASVNVAISAPAQPPGGGDPGPGTKPRPVVARVLPDRVRLRAVKPRDRRAPYRFKLRGKVVLPAGVLAAGCKGGKVQLAIRVGKKRLSRSATVAGDCAFRLTLKLGRKKARRVTVTPRFAGTAALAPLDGRALKLRAG
jgi:hypothetical protein